MAPKNQKNTNAPYAIAGLILALVACLATALGLVTKGIVGAGIVQAFEYTDKLNLFLQISIGLMILGLAYYAIMNPDAIRRFLSGRQARYGSNSLILALAFLGILITVNFLVYQNVDKKWDLTEDQSNTLAKETLQALGSLPEKVQATAFFTSQLDPTSATETLERFKSNSNNLFSYQFVDPDTNPVAARQAGITGDGKILLTMGDAKEIASSASETELLKALIRLANPGARTVYFLEGHGEALLQSGGSDTLSYSTAKSTLEAKNYTVKSLNLLTENKIPEDALAIIVAGPLKPISAAEATLLKKYVDNGGALVVMEDPVILTSATDTAPADPLANYLEKYWGITLNHDLIFDPTSSQNPLFAISATAGQHPITENITYAVIMPQARSISLPGAPTEGVTLTSLLSTSPNAWGETDLINNTSQYKNDPGVDVQGPLNMAVAGENAATKGRVVVIGNSQFASDTNFDAYGNGNFFINSVDWAADQEGLVNITPHQSTTRSMLPLKTISLIVLVIFSILIVPGAIVFLGVSSWVARRRRG
ncbi:MAG: GldG family protein [Anaerolineales bacterium]|nr:GldG family protein [Anaerolineales bacterium]